MTSSGRPNKNNEEVYFWLDRQKTRLEGFRRSLQTADRVLYGSKLTLFFKDEVNYSRPAMSVGDTITIHVGTVKDPLSPEGMSVILGLNYHEVAHVIYSPKTMDVLRKEIPSADIHYGFPKAYTLLEEHRVETLYAQRYSRMRKWFAYPVISFIIRDKKSWDTAFLLTHGRTYLPREIRDRFRKLFSQKTKNIDRYAELIDEYRVLSLSKPAGMKRGAQIINEFANLLAEDNIDPAEPTHMNLPQHGGPKGSTRQEDQDAASAATEAAQEAQDESDEQEEQEQPSKPQKAPQKPKSPEPEKGPEEENDNGDSDTGEGQQDRRDDEQPEDQPGESGADDDDDPEDAGGEDDDASSGEDDSDGREDSEERGSGGGGDIDQGSPEGGGDDDSGGPGGDQPEDASEDGDPGGEPSRQNSSRRAGVGSNAERDSAPAEEDPREGLTEVLQECLTEIIESQQAQQELGTLQAAMDNTTSVTTTLSRNRKHRKGAVTPEMLRNSEAVANVLREIWAQMEPGWVYGTSEGSRINMARASMAREPEDYDSIYDDYSEGQQDNAGLETVILADESDSTRLTTISGRSIYEDKTSPSLAAVASKNVWELRYAMNEIEAPCTVLTFQDDCFTLCDKEDKADTSGYDLLAPDGGTNPSKALVEARRIFNNSEMPNKILFVFTDGEWGGRYRFAIGEDETAKVLSSMGGNVLRVAILTGGLQNFSYAKYFDAVFNTSGDLLGPMSRVVVEMMTRLASN